MGARLEFEDWYRREHPRLVASLALVSGNIDLAREGADEGFARALVRWHRVGEMLSPGGWTYRVALNYVRRRQRRATLERRLLSGHRPSEPTIPEPAIEFWDAVRSLPERQRTAVVLRYVADLPEAEVAEAMGIARGTVASTLDAARRRIAPLLIDEPAAEAPHV